MTQNWMGGEWSYEDGLREQAERKEKWFQNVLIDASPAVLDALCRKTGREGLRGILHEGSLYWWSAWLGTHNDAVHWMKIDHSGRDNCVEIHLCDDDTIGLFAFDNETLALAEAHPSLEGKL